MQRKKNEKGFCHKRCIEVLELNLCDYFESKRKNIKPACHNCIHFKLLEEKEKEQSNPLDNPQI